MAIRRSFNGWIVLDEYPTSTFIAPGWKTVYVNSREVGVLLEAWARAWHDEVEPIAKSHPDNWEKPRERRSKTKAGKSDLIGIHSWRNPGTNVGTGDDSNHRSATCLDINGHLHPYEPGVSVYRDGFKQWQRDKIREILRRYRPNSGRVIGRTGLDFAKGKRDGMHIEIGVPYGQPLVTRQEVREAAKKAENYVGRSSTANVWFKNAFGWDVKWAQERLVAKGYDPGTPDGKAGDKTISAIKELQKDFKMTVDGRVGAVTRAELAKSTSKPTPQPDPKPKPEPIPEPPMIPNMDAHRLAGKNRYASAAAVAMERFPSGAEVVYLAVSDTPDAVVGSGFSNGPLLFVTSSRLPIETRNAILALKPRDVRCIGNVAPDEIIYEARQAAGLED